MLQKRRSGWFSQGNAASRRSSQWARPRRALPELLEARQLLAVGAGITTPAMAIMNALSRSPSPLLVAPSAYSQPVVVVTSPTGPSVPGHGSLTNPSMSADSGPLAQADATDVAAIRLEVVDLNGNPLVSLTQGTQFQLRGYVRDLRTSNPQLSQAYVDVSFNSALASTVGNVTIGSAFPNSRAGETPSAGLLDEVGGIAVSPVASGESLLFSVTLQAAGPGLLTFTSNAADSLPAHNIITDTTVPAENVDYGSVSLMVQPTGDRDLVAFAKALKTANVKLYGAAWSSVSTEQKERFQDGAEFLDFIEVTNNNRTPNQVAITQNIATYPTWVFADGSRLIGLQTLEAISLQSGIPIPTSTAPSLAPIGTKEVLAGSPLLVALDGYDANGGPLTYTVTSDNPSIVTPTVFSGNRSMRISVAEFGDMVFELFENRVPRATQHIIQLAENGFFDGVVFHRILDQFVIQGGDPTGTGTGGSDLGDFKDQFDVDLQHNTDGILSMAKTSDDTSDSQFFITDIPNPAQGPPRHLDFNHTIFGYLTEGVSTRNNISGVAASSSGTPTIPVTMEEVSIFSDTENRVLLLKAPPNTTGTTNVTVTVTDQQGNSTSQTFQVNVKPDTINGNPFLKDFTQTFSTKTDTPIDITLEAIDVEGDVADFASVSGSSLTPTITVTNNKVSVTPPVGFAGTLPILVGTFVDGGTPENSPIDTELVNVSVLGVDLLPESDTGTSSTDNLTNAASLKIRVGGVPVGSTVKLLHNSQVVGTATATQADDGALFTYDASGQVGQLTFQAEYTLNNVTTPLEHVLTVNIDRVAPDPFAESNLNLTVKANKTIQHNVQHPQEGSGITYRLVSGPIASSIDTNTGIFNWSAGFPQANTTIPFTIQAVDAAGNSVDLPVSLAVTAPEPKAEFTVVVEDLSGNPLELIPKNTEFVVKVFVQDVRTDVAAADRHVFKAYADLLFDPAVATVTGPLTIGPQFTLPSGTNTQSGLIDEAGGTNSTLKTSEKMLLFSQRFTAASKGTFAFQTAKAVKLNAQNVATKEHDIGLGFTTTPDSREVTYGKATIRVTDGFNAFNDAPEVNEDSTDNTLLVLANDSPGATITSVGTTNKGGTVTIAANQQSLIYTPAANYFGTETFTYTISNGTGGTNTATVDVFVVAQNDPPTAVADTFAAHGNSNSVLFRVQDNDLFTPDTTEPLTVTALTATSAGGTVVIATNGLGVRYTPPATTFVGTDTFTYTISDGKGGTSQALATINVSLAVPSSPDLLAASDSGRSSTDNTTNATSLQFEVTGGLAGGTIELFANGNSVGTSTVTDGKGTFTIDASALSGDVAFTTKQTVNGATSDASAPLTVKIDRTVPGNFTSTLPEVIFVGVAATYDTQNSEEGTVTYGLVSAPTGAFIQATTGVMTWTPVVAHVGTASFTITATDIAGNVANHLFTTPVADDEVEFTVQVVDKNGSAISSVGTGSLFTVNVYARDIRPFLNDSFKGVMNAFVDLAFDDAKLDAVGAPVISSIFSDSNTSTGTLTTGRIDGVGGRNSDQKSAARQLVMSQQFRAVQTGSVTFQSEFAQAVDGSNNPTTAFNVTIFDQTIAVPQVAIQYGSAALTVVAGLNAVADSYQFNEDVPLQTLDILTNDVTAPTSGVLTIKSVTPSAQGNTIAIASGGQALTYTPKANFHGAEVFQYTVEDESGAVSSATVLITVASVNDPPTATADTVNVVQNGSPIEIDVLANDSFAPDTGETLSISAVTQGSLNGTVEIIASNKRLRYTPATNAIGTETFTYSLSDGNGGTVVGQVTANIRIAGPTGIDLVAASDSGTSSTDNITNGTTLQFQVQGVTTGAEVRILAGTNVVGTTTATSSTATVSVDATQLTGQISFTAVQRLNGSDSVASPALNVTIDRVAPSTFQSTFPSIVFVGLPVTANTANSEEGTLAYGLTSAPTGVTIDPSTGVFAWTPTVAQIGPQTFSITATDVAGNIATQVVNSRVVDDEVAFAVRLLDSNDAAITTIGTGSTFTMEVTVRDLRDFIAAADRGIFNAFVDINFDQAKLELVGNTQINPVFNDNNSARPGTRTAGHIDGAGGINTDQKSSEAVWLVRQQFRALAAGATTLQTAFAQDFEVNNQPTGNFDLALFGQTVPVPEVAVQYGAASLTIVQALSAVNDSQQIVQGTTTTLDVIANDTAGPNSGTLLIEFVGNGTTAGATSAGGTVAITQNGTRISYVPPAGFVGSDTFSYRIKDSLGNTSTAQVNLTLTVGAPSSLDLLATSDSGSSNSDNITNATQLSLEVSGVQNGAEVQILRDATVLGTGTAGSDGKATISINASDLTGAVALTAKQKLNDVTSSASAPLTVTIDRVAPVAISSTAPTSATVGTQLTYNASHPDEGSNLFYSLVGAPTGAAINASTGELTWTPTIADVGTKSFTISAADLAGNAVTQPINLNVVGTQVAVTVRFVDHLGNVITKIGRDATFGVEVFVQDLRTNVAESTRGVKSAYVNYAYEANRVTTSGVADVDTIFEDASPQTGTAVTGGLNGVGGKNNDQNSAAPMRLVKQMFKATSVGSVTFNTSFATGTDRTVEVNGQTGAIPQGAIQFGTGTLTIEEGLTAVADTAQVTQDSNNTTISVLTNDVAGPTSSGLKITLISQPTNGTASIINNETQISYKPKAGFFGTDTLNYTITDGTGATRQQSVTITVNQTTSVAGSVFFDTNNNGIKESQERGLSNVEVKLDGTSTAGQAVHLTQRTDANGAYRFTSVAPGSYTVTQTQPGLVVNGGVLAANSYPVTTTLANPTVTGQNFTKASVAPKFAPLYALARTPAAPVEVVTNLAGAAQWQTTDSAWSDYTANEIILSSDLKSITLNVTRSNGTKLTDTISVNDRSLLQVMGEKDGMRLVRILGRPADFSFTPLPTTTTSTSSSGTLSSKIDLIFANGGV